MRQYCERSAEYTRRAQLWNYYNISLEILKPKINTTWACIQSLILPQLQVFPQLLR